MILNIETSQNYCSVALSNKEKTMDFIMSQQPNNHSQEIGVFVDKILKKNQIEVSDLEAIAVSSGPGSYTGLRIGVSMAKGLAYAANKPLIAVDTLSIMVQKAIEQDCPKGNDYMFCPMIDARRMEVFFAFFDANGNRISEISNIVLENKSFDKQLEKRQIVFLGNGSKKLKEIIENKNAIFVENIFPSSQFMSKLSYKKFIEKIFENVAYFEPLYIKPFEATKSKNKLW